MKFPPITNGTYKETDKATLHCSCGANVYFKEDDIFKFCSECGKKHNKMRVGTSSYSYSEVMRNRLSEVANSCTELYFEKDVVTSGPGHRIYELKRYHSIEASSYIDASKGYVKMHADFISVDVYTNSNKEVYNSSIKQYTIDEIRLEFSDEEIFKLTKEDLYNKLYEKAKGAWSNAIDKESYYKKLIHIRNLSIDEIEHLYSDSRVRKYKQMHIPEHFNERVGEFCKQWASIEEECASRGIQTNFTLVRPATIKRHLEKNNDAIVLTIRDRHRKDQDIIIMYSDIINGKYMSMDEFDFNTYNEKNFVVTLKGL